MSLIGPRPEQRTFVDQFERGDPSTCIVISCGQGSAAGLRWCTVMPPMPMIPASRSSTIFYYIKHFSLWLDVLIVFKTIRTILTGFGAR